MIGRGWLKLLSVTVVTMITVVATEDCSVLRAATDAPIRLVPLETANDSSGSDATSNGKQSQVEVDDIGLFPEQSGGYPYTLWQGTSYSQIVGLLPLMPINARSPAMRIAALKLLLSPGAAPRGRCGWHGGTGNTGPKTVDGKKRIGDAQRVRWARYRASKEAPVRS